MTNKLLNELNDLTKHHTENCKLYKNYVQSMYDSSVADKIETIPFLPVRAFKQHELLSVPESDIFKIMQSSGTSGQPSKIYIDKQTAKLQTNKLVDLFKSNFGEGRFPMLIIDCESTVRDRLKFSARTAGINGFSMFARKRCFALNEDLSLRIDAIHDFLNVHKNQPVFVFGFTYLIWSSLLLPMEQSQIKIDLQNSFILHGGGWKKLENEKISPAEFRIRLNQATGCKQIRNYYGMIEQTGTIYIECQNGRMHAAKGSTALIRSPYDLSLMGHGETGLIQVLSNIQFSYPGHSLLTEDIGRTYSGESCGCGNEGVVLEIDGRLTAAEVRGCSDAYN